MEAGLGALIAGGWTLDEVLDLSFGQLQVCIRAAQRFHAARLEATLTAIFGEPKGPKGTSAGTGRRPPIKAQTPGDLQAFFSAHGVRVEAARQGG